MSAPEDAKALLPPPLFAEGFPRDPALDALVDAFARGDYARVRREAPKLLATAESDDIKRAVRTLVSRTSADPLAVVLLALTGVLLVVLTAWWWRFNGPGPTPPRPQIVEHVKG